MHNLLSVVRNKATSAIIQAFALDDAELCKAEVNQSTQPQFGHYQCNSALKLAKHLKQNPRQVAQEIVSRLDRNDPEGMVMIEKVEIAGPGFINFFLSPSFISREIEQVLDDPHLGASLPEHPQKIIVEFSSPNIAKELHVGHLRSTIIGDCLARVFEFLGHDVLRLNHIGDWGTQFGMLIAYLEDEEPDVVHGTQVADLSQLMQWYRASKKKFDEDPSFKERAQKKVVALQGGDSTTIKAWELICDISRAAFGEIYRLLDITITERGESFYNPHLPKVIEDLESKGLITISDGAKCVFLEGFTTKENQPLPMIVQKSDGGYNYSTTDMAAMCYRIDQDRAERIIVVTDAGQILHFQMIEKACREAGYLDPFKMVFDHVPFGVVLGPDGKKFKTRSGETEKLIDLLTRAIDKARTILEKQLPDLEQKELDQYAQILGIDAIKYADLSSHRLRDYTFSYDRMLQFEGNTAPFLLYAYVRIRSIQRKVGADIEQLIEKKGIDLHHPTEIALALHTRQFGETLQSVESELLPNRLTDYLFKLAENFHAFFRDCRVQGSEEEASRLLLCEAVARVLEKGLFLLGLKTLPKM